MDGASEAQKFAEELHWCISQLELGLQRQSPDSRQAAETIKVLKILRSTKAPMVKKRQAMRNALGDYRKKMKDAEKKSLTSLRHSKFQPVGNMKAPTKSKFLRQSHSKQLHTNFVRSELNTNLHNLHLQQEGDDPQSSTNASSSFANISNNASSAVSSNFHLGDSGDHSSSMSQTVSQNVSTLAKTVAEINGSNISSQMLDSAHSVQSCSSSNEAKQNNNFKFVPSDNSFCFGFESTEEGSNVNSKSENDKEKSVGDDDDDDNKDISDNKVGSASKNFFKFEKSDNDFVFSFGQPDAS